MVHTHEPLAQPSPSTDFYAWANRDWLSATQIPADQPGINNFTDIQLMVTDQITRLLATVDSKPNPTQSEQQIAALYASYTDMARRDAQGLTALRPELAQIDAARTHGDIAVLFARLQKLGVDSPLLYYVTTDFAQSDRYIVFVTQAGLGLEREDYLGTDERTQSIRSTYQAFVQNVFQLAAVPQAVEQAQSVLKLEAALARIQWSKVDGRDSSKTYNPTDAKGLQAQLPTLPVSQQLRELGLPDGYPFNVMQPSYLAALSQFLPAQDVQAWKAYLKARLLVSYAKVMSQDFKKAAVNYEIKRGLYEQEQPMTRQAVDYINGHVGKLLGKIYVDNMFDERIKGTLKDIIQHIVDEYRLAIERSPRMTAQTKQQALDKLDKMSFKIGYPDKWPDYSALALTPGELTLNHKRIQLFEHQRNVARLGKPIDKNDWDYPPQVVNAFYEPSSNSFVLLAAILNPPFFSMSDSQAEHYGGIGFVIGHEIGHGFDDQGSRFDGSGNLRNWWAQEDLVAYNTVKGALIKQANNYEILPGRHLKGELEIGEIMGDASGAEIALRAYQKIVKARHLDEKQAYRDFFVQLAKTWRSKMRDDVALMLLDKDVHPPSEFRANGIVKNFDEFHEVFQTRPGDPMYKSPGDRVKIWP